MGRGGGDKSRGNNENKKAGVPELPKREREEGKGSIFQPTLCRKGLSNRERGELLAYPYGKKGGENKNACTQNITSASFRQ